MTGALPPAAACASSSTFLVYAEPLLFYFGTGSGHIPTRAQPLLSVLYSLFFAAQRNVDSVKGKVSCGRGRGD